MGENDLSNILRERASGFRMEPPAGGFGLLMQKRELERRRKRRKPFYYGAAAAIVAGLVISLFSIKEKSSLREIAAIEQQSPRASGPAEENITPEKPATTAESGVKTAIEGMDADPADQETAPLINVTKKIPALKNVPGKPHIPAKAPDHPVQKTIHSFPEPAPTPSPANSPTLSSFSPSPSQSPSAVSSLSPVGSIGKAGTFPGTKPVLVAENPGTPLHDSTNENTNTILVVPDSTPLPVKMPVNGKTFSRWAIVAFYTPRIVSSAYSANSEAELAWMKQYLDQRAGDEAFYSYETGIKGSYAFHRNFSLSAGIAYSTIQFRELRITREVRVEMSNGGGNTGVTPKPTAKVIEVDRNRYDNSFSYLDFPLSANLDIPFRKVTFQLSAGISYSRLTSTSSLVFNANDSLNVNEINDASNMRLQRHILSFHSGAYVAVPVYRRWSLYAGPVYRRNLNSLYSKLYVIRQDASFWGAEAGIKFSF